jgi:hypothetical protein
MTSSSYADGRLNFLSIEVPALESVVGFSTAFTLLVTEIDGLRVGGLVSAPMIGGRMHRGIRSSPGLKLVPG